MDILVFEKILSQEIVQKLGWTLIHSLWQGVAVAVVLAVILKMMKRLSSNSRYIMACIGLLIMVALPMVTFCIVDVDIVAMPVQQVALSKLVTESQVPANVIELQMPEVASASVAVAEESGMPLSERLTVFIDMSMPKIVIGWIAGVIVLSIWYLGGFCQLQRLRRTSLQPVSDRVGDKMKTISDFLGIRYAVCIYQSVLVQTPMVIGWLKPVILLPVLALSGLTSQQLEAILAHELAHIKRHDYLANMLQVVVEILGFYHPAVWWTSRKIRIERENCCDDMAVKITKNELGYAKALITIEEIRAKAPQLAVAASGGNLFDRISRLLGKEKPQSHGRGWISSVLAIVVVLALMIPAGLAISADSGETLSIAEQVKVEVIDDVAENKPEKDILSVFNKIDGQVIRFMAEKYAQIVTEAGKQYLYANSHVYYVSPDFTLYNGGIAHYYNWTGADVTTKTRLSGTSYPNQTLYDMSGQKLDVEITPDKTRSNFYHIYWTPDDPLTPGQSLYYGWSIDSSRKLYSRTGDVANLTMQNKFGSPAVETFFLVLPKQLEISQSSSFTGRQKLLNFNVYWWTKTVGNDESHLENVVINHVEDMVSLYKVSLEKLVSVSIDKSPSGSKLSVQYAVIAICKAAGVPYDWDKSVQMAEPERRKFIKPVVANNVAAKDLLSNILSPLNLAYSLDEDGLYIHRALKTSLELPEDSFVDVNGHIIDKVDGPFVNDNQVIGTWLAVDYVDEIEQFKVGQQQWKGRDGKLFLHEMIFEKDGKLISKNDNAPNGYPSKWKKGFVLYDNDTKTASKYIVRKIDDSLYMFYEWKSGDYSYRHQKPSYYVLKKSQEVLLPEDLRFFDNWSMNNFRNYFDCGQYENLTDEKYNEVEEQLIRQLSNGKGDDYYKAISGLGAIKSKKAIPFLAAIAFNRKRAGNRNRWMAVRALGLIGDNSVTSDLIHLMYHYNQNVRMYARISIIRITGQDLGDNWRKWGAWYKNKVNNKFSFTKIRWTDDQKMANEKMQKKTDMETIKQLKSKAKQ